MKIKLRSDDSGPPGPTEWSEMNDWLANLREDADAEPAADPGPSSTAEPQRWADVPAPAEPHDGATTGERPTSQSWGPSDSGTAQSWQATGGPAEPQAVASAAQPLSASVPEPDGAAEAQPFGPAQPQDAAEPQADRGTAEAYRASQAYVVDEPYGAAALDEGDGFHGHYGDYDLDDGHPGLHAADTAEPDVTTEPGDTAEAAVTDVAPDSNGVRSGAAAELLETPDAGVTGGAPVTGGSAGPVTPAAPRTSGTSWAPVTLVASPYVAGPVTPEAWMAPVAPGVPAAPAFAAQPTAPRAATPAAAAPPRATPAPAAPAPAPPAGPEPIVGALIGADLRTPMVWCELEPGSCVSWHGDREALGMADVRARAIAAGWRIDALGRLTCPQCQQRSAIFRATQQVVLWNRAYALTRAAREAARQGNYQYPRPAFYPR